MNKKIAIVILIAFLSCFLKGSICKYGAKKNKDIMQTILLKSKCNVEECGVRACYDSKKNPEQECLMILKRLSFSKGCNVDVDINDEMYCVSFKNDKVDGYIESIEIDGHREIIINISLKDTNNQVDSIHKDINYAISENKNKIKFFDYVKGKIPVKDIKTFSKSLENELKTKGVSNLKTYKVDNGITTTGYCGSFPTLYVDGEYVDLNYSICTYSSGNYIIIGTPILMTTY